MHPLASICLASRVKPGPEGQALRIGLLIGSWKLSGYQVIRTGLTTSATRTSSVKQTKMPATT